jgi:hypothetical protein
LFFKETLTKIDLESSSNLHSDSYHHKVKLVSFGNNDSKSHSHSHSHPHSHSHRHHHDHDEGNHEHSENLHGTLENRLIFIERSCKCLKILYITD